MSDAIHLWLARPAWLLLWLPLMGLLWIWWQRPHQRQWRQWLPPSLADRLLTGQPHQSRRHPALLSVIGLLLGLALVGPRWPIEAPAHDYLQNGVVVIQRMAPSLMQRDLPPSRLIRAQGLLSQLLQERQQGLTGLVLYAGSAHIASPLTRDAHTLEQLLQLVHPSVMPLSGDDPHAAFAQAQRLKPAQAETPLYWLWLTDQLPHPAQWAQLKQSIPESAQLLLVPLLPDSASLRTQLAELAQSGLTSAQLGSTTLTEWLKHPDTTLSTRVEGQPISDEQNSGYRFIEFSHWLLLLAVILLAWQSRDYLNQTTPLSLSGLTWSSLALAAGLGLTFAPPAEADIGHWWSADWQAYQALQAQAPDTVYRVADAPLLKAHAAYALGQYQQAAQLFSQQLAHTAPSQEDISSSSQPPAPGSYAALAYNTGTAWLAAGSPEKAIAPLTGVLEQRPRWLAACEHRAIAQALIDGTSVTARIQSCHSGQSSRAADQDSATAKTPSNSGRQPPPELQAGQPPPQCTQCPPLTEARQRTLELLEEDRWNLLRNRFRDDLERQP